jgi:DoxX-like family
LFAVFAPFRSHFIKLGLLKQNLKIMNTFATALPAQKTNKRDRIIYWVVTILVIGFDGGGAIGFNTKPAIDSLHHLGFPDYFRVELGIAKILGAILIFVPIIPARLKEWAYVGFGISTISAIIAHIAVGDEPSLVSFPIIILILLIVSYVYFHKIYRQK